MRNLLKINLTAEEIQEILTSSPSQALIPPLGAEAWTQAAENPTIQKWMGTVRLLAEKEAGREMPALTDDLYREFYATGGRLNFEAVYFERRRALGRAAICALIDHGNEKWIESLRCKLEEVFSEYSWAAPGHVNSPSGKDPSNIDLFAAETANLMAEIIDLFGAVLPGDLIAKIYWRLRGQFFDNYIHRHEDFWWAKAPNNWNAVCHQGVVGAALAVEPDLPLVSRMLLLAKKYLPLFLRGFGADGACSEGPGYWQYGFGAFALLNAQLETRTGGELSLFEGDAHVREIAKYGMRVSLANFHFVNFSDSPRAGALNPALLHYLGTRLDDAGCRAHAYRGYQRLAQTGINMQGQRTDLGYLINVFLYTPLDLSREASVEMEDVHFRDVSVLVAHGRDGRGHLWDFAAKGGNNAEHHNHNDCGSYILNIDGFPLVIEIGAPEYTKDYLREKRYQFLAARTQGHSLPIINGFEQAAGPNYAAKILRSELDEDHVEFSIDLTACYPPEAHCSEIVRNFYFDKQNGYIRVRDFYELIQCESFESAVIVDQDITVSEGVASITLGGLTLNIRPFGETVFAGVEDHEYRDPSGVFRKLKRVILKPARVDQQKFVGYDLVLA